MGDWGGGWFLGEVLMGFLGLITGWFGARFWQEKYLCKCGGWYIMRVYKSDITKSANRYLIVHIERLNGVMSTSALYEPSLLSSCCVRAHGTIFVYIGDAV